MYRRATRTRSAAKFSLYLGGSNLTFLSSHREPCPNSRLTTIILIDKLSSTAPAETHLWQLISCRPPPAFLLNPATSPPSRSTITTTPQPQPTLPTKKLTPPQPPQSHPPASAKPSITSTSQHFPCSLPTTPKLPQPKTSTQAIPQPATSLTEPTWFRIASKSASRRLCGPRVVTELSFMQLPIGAGMKHGIMQTNGTIQLRTPLCENRAN